MIFKSTDILLPEKNDMVNWAVIACDQFTSQPEYWEKIKKKVGDEFSTLHVIYPEAELSEFNAEKIEAINKKMKEYKSFLKKYADSYIYVERTLHDGRIRRGVVGVIDLEEYDYSSNSKSTIRATEETVIERIPPRLEIRKDACLEFSHVILLCDDEKKQIIENISERKDQLPLLYDFELMEEGGHVKGWLLHGVEAEEFSARLHDYLERKNNEYIERGENPVYFVVGDGNHSLATAKTNYEQIKKEKGDAKIEKLARYALVELENIHDEALVFEPIYRLVRGVDVQCLLENIKRDICIFEDVLCESDFYKIKWYTENENGELYLDKEKGELSIGILQAYLDKYLLKYGGEIDYIHEEKTVKELVKDKRTIGFMVPTIKKNELFKEIIRGGSLPRKTFSMGHAEEKRYYIESRLIRPV